MSRGEKGDIAYNSQIYLTRINCKTFFFFTFNCFICVGDAKFVQETRVECVVFKMFFFINASV